MRKSKAIDAIFPRTRQAVLAATLLRPDYWWYLSDLARHLGVRPSSDGAGGLRQEWQDGDLARHLGVRPSSLQREVATLVEAGILHQRRDGNRMYFQPNPDCPFLAELQGLMVKTVGLREVLREVLEPFTDRIDWAFVYGSMARSEELSSSDVDLMVIGRVGLADLTTPLRQAERRLNRPVNPTLYSREEFATKLAAGNAFLCAVLDGEKLFILGDPHELAATFSD